MIDLWIPRPPDNANNRAHWGTANREKRRYVEQLDERVAYGLIPAPKEKPIGHARIDVTWFVSGRKRMLDTDNAIRRLKPFVDWLVSRGYIAGDTPLELVWGPVEQVKRMPPEDAPPLSSVLVRLSEQAVYMPGGAS